MSGARPGAPDDAENVRLNEGRGRFYVEAKSVGGGSMLMLRGRKPLYREWLERNGANDFLKRSQKTTRFRDMIVEKFAAMYGLLMVEEEDKQGITNEMHAREAQVEHLQRKLSFIQDSLAVEEDAKRRMLLRYIHAVKEHAMSVGDGSGGVLQLPESNITDEEIHALAALLRNNTSIDELNLRGNNITDDGARALGAVLAGRSGLRTIDLRGNKIGKGAVRVLAEALERSERVRHVYVHAGGKIEALGAGKWAPKPESDEPVDPKLMVTVETVCVVDVRENNPEDIQTPYELQSFNNPIAPKNSEKGNGEEKFNATEMLKATNQPGRQSMGDQGATKSKKKALGKANAKRHSQEEPTPAQLVKQEKEARQRLMEERQLEAIESAWTGRAGTLESYNSGATEKQSTRLSGRAGSQTLPPLTDAPRAGSAPDNAQRTQGLDESSEQAVMGAIQKARSKQNKAKKASKTEMNLFNSPFAEPLTKNMTGVDSPQH